MSKINSIETKYLLMGNNLLVSKYSIYWGYLRHRKVILAKWYMVSDRQMWHSN